MTEKIIKAIIKGVIFGSISSLVMSLIMTSLLYFEIINVATSTMISYGGFVVILFITAFITARCVGSKGLFIGIAMAGSVIVLSLLYRFLGIETGIGLTFIIRSGITLLVLTMGAVMGVNTAK